MNNQQTNIENQLGKIPPQEVQIEEYVISALIGDAEAIIKVTGILSDVSFYKEQNRVLFGLIRTMYDNGIEIDLMTVTTELKRRNLLDAIGGFMRITKIASKTMSSIHIVRHAKIVAECFKRRELIIMAEEVLNNAYDMSYDIDEVFSFAQEKVEKIMDINSNEAQSSACVVTNAIEEISDACAQVDSGKTAGIPTPLKELNTAMGGWKAPMFSVIGARPGVGKTTYALNFAICAAEAGYWVSFYTYEMLTTGLMKLVMTMKSDVNRVRVRDGLITESDWDNINSIAEKLSGLKINWYDNPDIDALQIRANTHREKKQGKCELVIIDYLQLMTSTNKRSREQEVAGNSRTIKKITTGLEVPVIALSQLSRDIEKRVDQRPKLSDLRESGSLEQDADMVAFIHNETDIDADIKTVLSRHFIIAKNRNGTLGEIEVLTDSQMTRIFDRYTYEALNVPLLDNEVNDRYEKDNKSINSGFNPPDNPF